MCGLSTIDCQSPPHSNPNCLAICPAWLSLAVSHEADVPFLFVMNMSNATPSLCKDCPALALVTIFPGFVLPCAKRAFCCAAVRCPSLNIMYKPFLYACLIKSSPYFHTTGCTLPTRFFDLLIRSSTLIIYHPSAFRSFCAFRIRLRLFYILLYFQFCIDLLIRSSPLIIYHPSSFRSFCAIRIRLRLL